MQEGRAERTEKQYRRGVNGEVQKTSVKRK
jgi:hypothetical protein